MPTYFLPIQCNRHTSVCGERCTTNVGKRLWAELDWAATWAADDSLQADFTYLHVVCKTDGRSYRVRCWYEPGEEYRKGQVRSIGLGSRAGRLCWVVRTGDVVEGKK